MIKLYQLPPAFGLPVSVSPFCVKLELYFKLTGRTYETVVGDLRKSPNKQVPYVEWPNGEIVAESAEIIARLENEGPSLDQGLSAAEIEVSENLTAQAEDAVYFACLYSRFVEDNGWVHQKPNIKALVPAILAPILVPVIRRSQVKRCAENGFANRDGYAAAITAITNISDELANKSYLLNESIHTVDCAVWANRLHTFR